MATGRAARRATPRSMRSSLPEPYRPLADIVAAFDPLARLTVISMGDQSMEVIAATHQGSDSVGTTIPSPSMATVCSRLLTRGACVIDRDDLDIAEDFDDILEQAQFGRAFVAPLCTRDGVTQFAVVDKPGVKLRLEERDFLLLSAAAAQASAALENENLRALAAERHRVLEAVARLGVIFTSELDPKWAAAQVVDYASLLLGLPAFVLLFRTDKSSDYAILGSEGLPVDVAELAVKSEALPILENLTQPGAPPTWSLSGKAADPFFGRIEREGFTHVVAAPLALGEDKLGGVLLGFDREPIDLHDAKRDAFHLLAMQATTAIGNAERYEAVLSSRREATRELETTSLLLSAARALASNQTLAEVLDTLTDVILTSVGHSRATVSLWNDRTGELAVTASRGDPPVELGLKFELCQLSEPARLTLERRTATLIDFDALDPEGRGAGGVMGSRLSLDVPLVYRERLVGLLMVDDGEQRQSFTDRQIAIVEGIAAQAAVVIENARLHDVERTIANRLQEALLALPEQVECVEFAHAYHSATEAARVGGDFYDLFELGHDKIGIVIGDVAGKGLDAAVLTSLVKNTIRAHASEPRKTPAQILRLTNDLVYTTTQSGVFVTVTFGRLDCRDGRLVYSNAGHTTGAILRADGTVGQLVPTGPFLGAYASVEFEQAEASIGLDELLSSTLTVSPRPEGTGSSTARRGSSHSWAPSPPSRLRTRSTRRWRTFSRSAGRRSATIWRSWRSSAQHLSRRVPCSRHSTSSVTCAPGGARDAQTGTTARA